MGRLENKTAIVTGAASGIGRGIALRFAQEGAAIGVLDVNETACRTVADEIVEGGGKALALGADLRQLNQVEQAVTRFVDTFGPPNVLVNNAAIMPSGLLHETSLEDFDRAIAVNLRGIFLINKVV